MSSISQVPFLRATFPLGWSPVPVKSPSGGISSSVLLSGPRRRLSHCPIGISSDNHIVISSALSNDHKSLALRPSDMVPLLPVSKSVYNYQYMIASRVGHAELLMVYLHDLVKFRAFQGLKWKFHFSTFFHLQIRQTWVHPPFASLSQPWSIKPVQYFLLYLVYPLMSHLVVRSEQNFRLV